MTDKKIRVKEHDRKAPDKTKAKPVTTQPTQGVERIDQRTGKDAPAKGVTILGGSSGNPKEKGVEIHSARRN